MQQDTKKTNNKENGQVLAILIIVLFFAMILYIFSGASVDPRVDATKDAFYATLQAESDALNDDVYDETDYNAQLTQLPNLYLTPVP